MKKYYRKAVLILMLLPLITIIGCGTKKGDQYEKASARILEALEEKYGEEFELDKIGAGSGTMNDNTIKATVRPKSDTRILFEVEITKDLKKVYDKYLNVLVAQNNLEPITQLAQQVWSDSRVEIFNDTVLTYPTDTDRDMSYQTFLERYPSNWQVITIFVNASDYIDDSGAMDEQGELDKYKAFAEQLAAHRYFKSSVYLVYLSEEAFGRYDELSNEALLVDHVYTSEESDGSKQNSITRNGFDILENGQIKESDDDILRTFSVWEGKRKTYAAGVER
ncbi:hypothetical protein [Paenibacillus soyae]|uniref:Lipoprotein n=1 Tax=Paenibacillus soyae TaxID=2969249 RepID=A0A9X2S7T0_9BACL|nr:hypothetical protein [Paenibacillus soyae]MCR2803391.1 hypothetical protein [Paenibacillus soyae]